MASKALILFGLFAVLLFVSNVATVSGRELGTVKQSYGGKGGPISYVDGIIPIPRFRPIRPGKGKSSPRGDLPPTADQCGSKGCCGVQYAGLCAKCCSF